MLRRYVTVDVFTDRRLSGNPLAVVVDAEGLSDAQMQALAAEFNYVETTFVLPAAHADHDAHLRIFTPDREVPFAGHPTIGTAFALAQRRSTADGAHPRQLVFEEAAGLVAVDLLTESGAVVGAEILAPQTLSRLTVVDAARAAACLGLTVNDIRVDTHSPQVVSVGLPFLVFELASPDALRRARPDRRAYDSLFPLDGASAVYVYTREPVSGPGTVDVTARMFTSRLVEDPATGSAAGALTALLSDVHGGSKRLRVRQGEVMGRPSTIYTQSLRHHDGIGVRVSGRCVEMFTGTFDVESSEHAASTHPHFEEA